MPTTVTIDLRRLAWGALKGLLIAVLVGWPWIGGMPTALVNDASRAAEYALVGTSLVLLTGWVGQISLAQGSFVGIGAFITGLVFRDAGIGFPYSLPFAVVASTGAAMALGMVALRVRGLYLAVATMIFAWMADQFLFSAPWFIGEGGSTAIRTDVIGRANGFPSFDLHDARVFYLLALAGVAVGLYVASNLRDSKTGRAFFAVRGSEVAAASLGIHVTRYKLLAFGISGALAGLAGNLQIVGEGSIVPAEFNFLTSLFFLSIAVVGGLNSLPGSIIAAMIFSALNEVFFRVSALNGYIDLVSGLLLLGVLVAYPGGVAAALGGLGRFVLRLVRRTPTVEDEENVIELPTPTAREESVERHQDGDPEQPLLPLQRVALAGNRDERPTVLEADGITVRFGGLVAVDSVSLSVHEGEIVGLIGPNGAGKTTLFNAIAGLNNPTAGRVFLFGQDVTELPVHERAALGVGRTFQLIQLFPQLNVFDNLLAATHLQNRTGFVQHMLVTERALSEERAARRRVTEVIERLGLTDVAHRTVSGLPFGVLRTVELARSLVTGASFIMLDEPASGLDNAETDRLARLLESLRTEMGLTLLLIEHDVPMVTRVCDYIYVINRGRPLADGTAEEIQQNPDVVDAYLGGAPVAEATA